MAMTRRPTASRQAQKLKNPVPFSAHLSAAGRLGALLRTHVHRSARSRPRGPGQTRSRHCRGAEADWPAAAARPAAGLLQPAARHCRTAGFGGVSRGAVGPARRRPRPDRARDRRPARSRGAAGAGLSRQKALYAQSLAREHSFREARRSRSAAALDDEAADRAIWSGSRASDAGAPRSICSLRSAGPIFCRPATSRLRRHAAPQAAAAPARPQAPDQARRAVAALPRRRGAFPLALLQGAASLTGFASSRLQTAHAEGFCGNVHVTGERSRRPTVSPVSPFRAFRPFHRSARFADRLLHCFTRVCSSVLILPFQGRRKTETPAGPGPCGRDFPSGSEAQIQAP